MLRTVIIELLIQGLEIAAAFFDLLLLILSLFIRIRILYVDWSVIVVIRFSFHFHRRRLIHFFSLNLLLARFFLQRSGNVGRTSGVGDRRNCIDYLFFILVVTGWLPHWRLFRLFIRLMLTIPSLPQFFYFLVDYLGIIVIFSSDGLLLPLLKTSDLESHAFESIDFVFDVFGIVVVFLLYCSLFLSLKFFYTVQRALIDI